MSSRRTLSLKPSTSGTPQPTTAGARTIARAASDQAGGYVVRFLDGPAPTCISLQLHVYYTNPAAPPDSQCLQTAVVVPYTVVPSATLTLPVNPLKSPLPSSFCDLPHIATAHYFCFCFR